MSNATTSFLSGQLVKNVLDGSGNVATPRTAFQVLGGSGLAVVVTDNPATNPPSTTISLTNTISSFGQYNVTLTNGVNHNIATTGLQTLRIGGPTAAFSMGGFTPPSAGAYPYLLITNTTNYAGTFLNSDAGSTSSWRINTQSGGTSVFTLPKNSSALLFYDSTSAGWVLQNIGIHRPTHYHVEDYGADPTGATPSTSAITTAFNLAAASGTNATVQFGSGTYTSSGIVMTVGTHSGIRVQGASCGSDIGVAPTIIKLTGSTTSLLSGQGLQVQFEDIWFHGNNAALNGVAAIQYLSNLVTFKHCLFTNAGTTTLPGTFTCTNGSPTVTTTSDLTAILSKYDPIHFSSDLVSSTANSYTVTSVSAGSIGISYNFQGTTGAGATGTRPECVVDLADTPMVGTFTVTQGSGTATTSVSQVGALVAGYTLKFLSDPNNQYVVQTVSSGNVTFLPAYVPTASGVITTVKVPLEIDSVRFEDCQICQDPTVPTAYAGWAIRTNNLNASHVFFKNCYVQQAYYAVWNNQGGLSFDNCEFYNYTVAMYAFSNTAFSTYLKDCYTEGGSFPYLLEVNPTTNPLSSYNPITVKNFSAFTAGGLKQNTFQLLCKQPIIIEHGQCEGNIVVDPDPTAGIYHPTIRDVSFQYNPSYGVTLAGPGPGGIVDHAEFCDIEDCTMPAVGSSSIIGLAGPFTGTVKYSMRHDGPLNVVAWGAINDAYTVGDAGIAAGSKTLNSATANFPTTCIGQQVCVSGAGSGGARYNATILTRVSATQVLTDTFASTPVLSARCDIGTNNETPYANIAISQGAGVTSRPILFPSGGYLMLSSTLSVGACVFEKGAVWVMGQTATPQITGPITADPDTQIFSFYAQYGVSSSTIGGLVTVLGGTQPIVPCEWFSTSCTIPEAQAQAATSPLRWRNALVQRLETTATFEANNDNLTCPTQEFTVVTLPNSACQFSGIAPPLGTAWTKGMQFEFLMLGASGGSTVLTITHNATSTAGNRIYCQTGANIVKTLGAGVDSLVRVRYTSAHLGGCFEVLEPAS